MPFQEEKSHSGVCYGPRRSSFGVKLWRCSEGNQSYSFSQSSSRPFDKTVTKLSSTSLNQKLPLFTFVISQCVLRTCLGLGEVSRTNILNILNVLLRLKLWTEPVTAIQRRTSSDCGTNINAILLSVIPMCFCEHSPRSFQDPHRGLSFLAHPPSAFYPRIIQIPGTTVSNRLVSK